jgi:GNAT superfamily N-acetyltransferase
MKIRSATEADAAPVSSLIHSVSGTFILSPDGSGAEPFLDSITAQAVRGYISASNFSYLVAEIDDELAGAVALRDNSHLYHLFVAQAHQGKGMGRSLWLAVKQAALQTGNGGRFTVNSSLNAISVYKRFGFIASGPRVEKNGLAFLPMQLVTDESGG